MSKREILLSKIFGLYSAAVIIDGSRILATERGYGEYKGGWEFPGGKREEGESGEDTVIREIKEELGADITVDRFLCTVEYQYKAFLLIMDCYVCHVVSGMITITEHIAMKWLDSKTIDSVEWLPADLAVLPYVRSLFNDAK